MRITKSDLDTVAVKPSQYPPDTMAEIAFAGRSNVGKSSLLNLLTGRKKLARVSGSPGKTRTINFYLINDAFRIVDLPGYGYAKVSKSVTENWGDMMETYFQKRDGLRKVIQLVDIRHKPTAQDVQKSISVIRKTLELSPQDKIIPVSALKRTGYEELLLEIEQILEE